eukprot:1154097-Prorocentrum_lima.AAC.1
MTSSLVGSEMCIRDSLEYLSAYPWRDYWNGYVTDSKTYFNIRMNLLWNCLLYTSDAADDM